MFCLVRLHDGCQRLCIKLQLTKQRCMKTGLYVCLHVAHQCWIAWIKFIIQNNCMLYMRVFMLESFFAVNLHSDGCLRNDVQNTTQTTAGLSLDWKLTLGKQSIGPAAGHNNVENTQTKQQENTKWPDAATVVGNAPLCRHRQLRGRVNLLISCFESQLYAFFIEMCESEKE